MLKFTSRTHITIADHCQPSEIVIRTKCQLQNHSMIIYSCALYGRLHSSTRHKCMCKIAHSNFRSEHRTTQRRNRDPFPITFAAYSTWLIVDNQKKKVKKKKKRQIAATRCLLVRITFVGKRVRSVYRIWFGIETPCYEAQRLRTYCVNWELNGIFAASGQTNSDCCENRSPFDIIVTYPVYIYIRSRDIPFNFDVLNIEPFKWRNDESIPYAAWACVQCHYFNSFSINIDPCRRSCRCRRLCTPVHWSVVAKYFFSIFSYFWILFFFLFLFFFIIIAAFVSP